jgi:hypothetical protein
MSFRSFHEWERRYLSVEAMGFAYRCYVTEQFPTEVIERAINESLLLGRSGHMCIDQALFSAVLNAVWEEEALLPSGSVFLSTENTEREIC